MQTTQLFSQIRPFSIKKFVIHVSPKWAGRDKKHFTFWHIR